MTFAEKVLQFHLRLKSNSRSLSKSLPGGIRLMNPFEEYEHTIDIARQFFFKYLDDENPRHLILGINPGRFGAGLTGIPFTDPKRMVSECGIRYQGKMAHEPSSVFIYEMIHAYGGSTRFYKNFYINSPCPLGFTSDKNGKEVNYNYYDSQQLFRTAEPFMINSIKRLIALGIKTDTCFCLGTGKNAKHLEAINKKWQFFGKIIPLEHPRYIMQYKSRDKQFYIDKYITCFRNVLS